MDIVVGGFGELRNAACPGIEQLILKAGGNASNDSDDAALLSRGRLLADVPSPTWMELHTAADGSQVLYAVLEDTNEIASFRVEGVGDSLRLVELSRVPTPGHAVTHVVFVRDDEGQGRLITADYADGYVCVHPVTESGVILEVAQMLRGEGHGPLPAQECPHAHWVQPLPDGRVLTSDLGADRIYVHHWEHGELIREGAVTLAPGTGPRDQHLLPVDSDDPAHDWRVAVAGEWGGTVTLIGPEPGHDAKHSDNGTIRVLQTVSLGPDALPKPDQAASLAFVPWNALQGNAGAVAASEGIAGLAYVGLRGSERIVTLLWDGKRLTRLDEPDVPGWRGRGIDCAGSRPRHLLAIGNLLLAANEASNNVAIFRLSADGEPNLAATLPSGAPTVFVRL